MKVTTDFGTVKIVMLKGEKGDTGENGYFEDLTEEQIESLKSDIRAYYKKVEGTYTTTGDFEQVIPIDVAGYTSVDVLTVNVEGLNLVEGVDYTINGNNITLVEPITHIGTRVNFCALRSFAVDVSDFDLLKAEEAHRAYETVAAMQADTNLANGMIVRTLGFNSIGDGGGAYYAISASGTADGTTVIACGDLFAHFVPTTGLVSVDTFAGETIEDKLFTALDSIEKGTILCGDVTITKVYNALAKDYRNITILGAKFNLTIDNWFIQANSIYNTVVQFDSCVFNGNGHTIFSSQNNVIGMHFNSCILDNVTAYNSTIGYAQSPYFNSCTMFNVGNLITATITYDFKMIGCRVEAATSGILFSFTDSAAIRQGVVSDCLIEGRGDVVFSVGGMYAFTIENCYFEALNNGLLIQNGNNVAVELNVFNCAFYTPMNNVDYAITLNSSAYALAKIRNNITNLPSGKYLCNRSFQPPIALKNAISNENINYGTSFKNSGFPAYQGRNTPIQTAYETNAVWDADNSAWKMRFMLDYEEAYHGLHPIYVVFQACYGSSTQYAGFAIVRLTPRTAYNGSGIVTVCDATVVDACNAGNMIKTWTGSVSVELSTDTATASSIVYTLSIQGFNDKRTPRYRVIDPWYIVGLYNIPAE